MATLTQAEASNITAPTQFVATGVETYAYRRHRSCGRCCSWAPLPRAVKTSCIGSVFGASVDYAAWKTIPSWYLVAQEDQAINPELKRFYAKRMGAKTTEIKSSHVPFISHPPEVARLIEQAASAAAK